MLLSDVSFFLFSGRCKTHERNTGGKKTLSVRVGRERSKESLGIGVKGRGGGDVEG